MQIQKLIEQLRRKEQFILAIDGMCASGKSTLANQLSQELNAYVLHMDDFYLPIELRTDERYQQPGGNIHYERFLETVLKPLSRKETVFYQPFDCTQMKLSKQIVKIPYHPYIIVEGSYALKPEFVPYYTDIIVLKITALEQFNRLQKRNPDQIEQFINQWIPLENKYFDYYQIYEKYPIIRY